MNVKKLDDKELVEREDWLEEEMDRESAKHEGAWDDIKAFNTPSECMGIIYRRFHELEREADQVWLEIRQRGLRPWPKGW